MARADGALASQLLFAILAGFPVTGGGVVVVVQWGREAISAAREAAFKQAVPKATTRLNSREMAVLARDARIAQTERPP